MPITAVRLSWKRPAQYMQLAKDHGMTSAQLALAWCYSRWFIDATIIGGTKLEHLKENIDAISISLSDQIVDRINEIHSLITNRACEQDPVIFS